MNPFPIVMDAMAFAFAVPLYVALLLLVCKGLSINGLEQDDEPPL